MFDPAMVKQLVGYDARKIGSMQSYEIAERIEAVEHLYGKLSEAISAIATTPRAMEPGTTLRAVHDLLYDARGELAFNKLSLAMDLQNAEEHG